MTAPMSGARLDEIQALADAATDGPWEAQDSERTWSLHMAGFPFQILKAPKSSTPYAEYWPSQDDARFIVASRTAVPELLAEVRRLRAEQDRLTMLARAYGEAVEAAVTATQVLGVTAGDNTAETAYGLKVLKVLAQHLQSFDGTSPELAAKEA